MTTRDRALALAAACTTDSERLDLAWALYRLTAETWPADLHGAALLAAATGAVMPKPGFRSLPQSWQGIARALGALTRAIDHDIASLSDAERVAAIEALRG